MSNLIDELTKIYQSFGYNNVKILNEAEILTNNSANVFLEFKEGKITKIKKINFAGNKNYDNSLIQSKIKSKTKKITNIFANNNFKLFQIDNDVNDGEKILLNSEFIDNFEKDKIMLLGMGKPAKMPHEPSKTGIDSINFKSIFYIQLSLFKAIYKRIYYRLKFFIADKFKRKLQNIFGKKSNVNTKK